MLILNCYIERMKKKYFLVLTILVFHFSFSQQLSFEVSESDDQKIVWSADRKLTWDDFKGEPTTSNNRVAAMTSTEFIVQTKTNNRNRKVEVLIENIFICNESWVRNDKKNSAGLLEHEQGHFDLNELHVRKLRLKITSKTTIKQVEKLIQEAYQLSSEGQNLFDKETNHGIDKIKQKEWLIRISKELKDLEIFIQ